MAWALQYDITDQGFGIGHIWCQVSPPAQIMQEGRAQLISDAPVDYQGKRVDLTDPENPVLVDIPPDPSP